MAKKSMVNKNKRRIATAARFRELRAELKETIRSPKSSDEEFEAALLKLQKLPRDSSRTRIRNRCLLTGRPRGYYRKFGLSRMGLRQKALEGLLPGVKKASW